MSKTTEPIDELNRTLRDNYMRCGAEELVQLVPVKTYGEDIQHLKPGDDVALERNSLSDNHAVVQSDMTVRQLFYHWTKTSMLPWMSRGRSKGDLAFLQDGDTTKKPSDEDDTVMLKTNSVGQDPLDESEQTITKAYARHKPT